MTCLHRKTLGIWIIVAPTVYSLISCLYFLIPVFIDQSTYKIIPYTGTVDLTIDVGPAVFFLGGGRSSFLLEYYPCIILININWLVLPKTLLSCPNIQTFGESMGSGPKNTWNVPRQDLKFIGTQISWYNPTIVVCLWNISAVRTFDPDQLIPRFDHPVF